MAEAQDLAGRYLEGWSGTAAENRSGDVPAAKPTEILLVNRPGSAQSNILVGNLTMRPGDPDYYATVVANKIFGGGVDARLFLIFTRPSNVRSTFAPWGISGGADAQPDANIPIANITANPWRRETRTVIVNSYCEKTETSES